MKYVNATQQDGDSLAELRAITMQPSLAALGRYDEQRVKSRLLDHFVPDDTWKIVINNELAGFFVLRDNTDHLYLDHLYIHPAWQKQKLGSTAITHVFSLADARKLPLRLGALRNSPANRFYLSKGFIRTGEGEFDIYYERQPVGST